MSALDAWPHRHAIETRWGDNDVYGHVNNVVYYAWFDTAINDLLIRTGGLDIHAGPEIGLRVESHCTYRAPLAFPGDVEVGVRIGSLGRSSVRYELGLFDAAGGPDGGLAATGHFVHVFVDRDTRRPVPIPDDGLRAALERLRVAEPEAAA